MFIDYYTLLDIEENSSPEEIRAAFKKQALKWHPDRNKGLDTTDQMQKINEAYLILKDFEARERYNKEYWRFKEYQKSSKAPKFQYTETKVKEDSSDYKVNDDILERWMENARKQAIDLARKAVKDFKDTAVVGVKEATKGMGQQLAYQIIAGCIMTLLFALLQTCKN